MSARRLLLLLLLAAGEDLERLLTVLVVVFAVVVVVHLEGPASCICSSKWNGLLQMTIRRGWALASDHPSPMLGSRFNLTDLSRKIFVDIFDSQSNIN